LAALTPPTATVTVSVCTVVMLDEDSATEIVAVALFTVTEPLT
jgi:hypothetical protein